MSQTNVFFCCKVFLYYADLYRPLLARTFSLATQAVSAFVELSAREKQLTIEEKEKMALVVDGLLNMCGFAFKVTYDKILELV